VLFEQTSVRRGHSDMDFFFIFFFPYPTLVGSFFCLSLAYSWGTLIPKAEEELVSADTGMWSGRLLLAS